MTKRILSLFLVFIIVALSLPVSLAADTVALTTKNVTEWPTVTYLNPDGKMYFGQTVGEGIALTGGKVEYNGVQVPGHFEHIDPNQVVTTPGTTRVNMKFVPDDTNAFSGFEKKRSADCKYTITTTQPLYVDEVNDPVVASEVEPGATLSTSVLSGGKMYNPYNINETKISTATWSWTDSTVVVTESGYYEAVFYPVGYVRTTAQVYVKVKSNALPTEIVELPTATVTYGTKWNELILEGGKVMTKDTNEEVEGSFVIDNVGSSVIGVGIYTPNITFIPNDTEKYLPCVGTATVTVTKANYKFVNENGEEIVPELTLPYGTTFNTNDLLGNSLKAFIKDYDKLSGVDIVGSLIFEAGDKDTVAPVGTNTYNVRVRPYNSGTSNYNVTDLQFILTIEPVVFTTSASWGTDGAIKGKLSHKVPGTFDVYVDGVLAGDDINGGDSWSFDYPIPATGDYTIKVVYNPVENDPYSMVDFEKVVTAKIRRSITYADATAVNHKINGDERTPIAKLGDTVELSTFGGVAFLGWKITDASGNEVDLGIADLTATEITFTMPDCDLFVEAMYQKDEPADDNNGLGGIFGDLDLGDLTEGDSESKLVNIINNIIALFRNIIEKITGFFRAIGDAT